MSSAEASISLDGSADLAWEHVGDFGGLNEWMPGVESCDVDGDVRTLAVFGMEIKEQLVSRDDATRVLEYKIIDSPLNAESHLGRITVHEEGAGSRVTWYVEVEPDSLVDLLVGTYQQALEALKNHLEENGS